MEKYDNISLSKLICRIKKPIIAAFRSDAVNLALMFMGSTLKEQHIEIKSREPLSEEPIRASKDLQQKTIEK